VFKYVVLIFRLYIGILQRNWKSKTSMSNFSVTYI